MNEVNANIERLEEKAISLKNGKKYLEALKRYEEVIALKKENFGDRDEGTLRTSGEAAIVCNILSMSFFQKGRSILLQLRRLFVQAQQTEVTITIL